MWKRIAQGDTDKMTEQINVSKQILTTTKNSLNQQTKSTKSLDSIDERLRKADLSGKATVQ